MRRVLRFVFDYLWAEHRFQCCLLLCEANLLWSLFWATVLVLLLNSLGCDL